MMDNQLELNLQEIKTILNSMVGMTDEILTAEQTETLDILNNIDGVPTEITTYDSPEEVEEIFDQILGNQE